MNELRPNLPELTVSQLAFALKRTIEEAYGYVRVRGELGNVKYHSSGHIYLDLKDNSACLAGVIWRTTATRIRITLEAGLEVVVTGRVTTYPGQSKYQIVIETLEPAGLGALMALVEERKKRLAAAGLFDAARKKPLPFLPAVIGVITSPSGAVIRDILHRLADRFPRRVLLWPVKVQGDGSAEQVTAAIRGFNALADGGRIPRPDLLIVARGGGSLEDLWSFNDETVVRAAAESDIPLISGVGHETDVTLIDFAADKRAPTPTAAAEMAVPVRADLLLRIDSLARRSIACWQRGQQGRRTELRAAVRALPTEEGLFALPRQRLDHASGRLPRALIANARLHRMGYSRIAGRLTIQALGAHLGRERKQLSLLARRAEHCMAIIVERRRERYQSLSLRLGAARFAYVNARRARIARGRDRLVALEDRSKLAVLTALDQRAARVERAGRLLAAVSYRAVLARGFALARNISGKPLRNAAAVGVGLRFDIEFSDGRVRALSEARSIAPATEALPAKPRRRGGGGEGQGSLFGT
ncbi:MAG TPA: exodeoxyribonuclease VII large subunit [Xanthobacteraceae bacterium]|jgi:exodeoxyribonuclease VII large subunit